MHIKLFKKTVRTPEEKAQLKKERKYLALSGILIALGFPPIPLPLTLFIALIPFFKVIEQRKTLAEINRAAYMMAFIAGVGALYWVGGYTQAKDPYLMIGGFLMLLLNPAMFLIPSTLYYFSRKYFNKHFALLLFPFFWVTYEYLYTVTDWSFPWLNFAHGICSFTLFIQIADIIGSYGLALIIVIINVALYYAWQNYKQNVKLFRISTSIAVILFIIPLIYGIVVLSGSTENSKSSIKIGIVQPNLDPYDKWADNNVEGIARTCIDDSHTLLGQGIDLLIWPETALPVYIVNPDYRTILDSLYRLVNESKTPLLTGMPDLRIYEGDQKKPHDVKYSKKADFYYATYNAIYLFNPGSYDIQKYGKSKLVPFGERVPFVDQIPVLADLMRWGVGISGWNVGEDTSVFTARLSRKKESIRLGGVVCYESIYPELSASFVQKGAQTLVVVTNDSWYGNTSGPYQHRDYVKLRAVENRRCVVRAANGGISCIIDQYGRVTSQTRMYEHTTFTGSVNLLDGMTFYTKHPHLVTTLALIVSCMVVIVAAIIGMRRRLIQKGVNA